MAPFVIALIVLLVIVIATRTRRGQPHSYGGDGTPDTGSYDMSDSSCDGGDSGGDCGGD